MELIMDTILEEIPQTGNIQLTIQITSRFNYSAIAAKRLVHRFVNDEISYLLRVDEPALVAQKRLVWRVPVQIAFPDRTVGGLIGTVDVDVEDGRLYLTPAQIDTLRQRALELATTGGLPRAATGTTL
jgi:hypothetical protein